MQKESVEERQNTRVAMGILSVLVLLFIALNSVDFNQFKIGVTGMAVSNEDLSTSKGSLMVNFIPSISKGCSALDLDVYSDCTVENFCSNLDVGFNGWVSLTGIDDRALFDEISVACEDIEEEKAAEELQRAVSTSEDEGVDLAILSTVGLLFAFVVLLLGVYLYEKKSLMAPVRGKRFHRKPKVKPVKPKVMSKSKQVKSKNILSGLFSAKKKPVKKAVVKQLSNLDVFNSVASDITSKLKKPGFDAIAESRRLGSAFNKLSVDEQEKNLRKFLSVHKKIENTI